jgi:hypothetical protein
MKMAKEKRNIEERKWRKEAKAAKKNEKRPLKYSIS